MKNRSTTADRPGLKEVMTRQKTREKLGKNKYEDVRRPQKLTLLSKPMAKLGSLCQKIEDLKTKNLKCIDTLTKYEEGHSSYSWKSGYVQFDDTSYKVKAVNKSYQGSCYGQRQNNTSVYYQQNTIEKDAVLSSGSQQTHTGHNKRLNISALNNNLKQLLQKRCTRQTPPTFSELKLKARHLSHESRPLSIQSSMQQRAGDIKLRTISSNKSNNIMFDAKAVDKSISQLDKNELFNLKEAIDRRMRSIHKQKDSDSDSTFEVQLAECNQEPSFNRLPFDKKKYIGIYDQNYSPSDFLKPLSLEKSIAVAGKARHSSGAHKLHMPESKTELDIEAYIHKYYKAAAN